jgi:hypothetical protein
MSLSFMKNKTQASTRLFTFAVVVALIAGCAKDPQPSAEDPFVPRDVQAHYKFEGNAADDNGMFNPAAEDIIDITYEDSHNAAAGKAASFNGSTSLIEIANCEQLLSHKDFSIAFWIKANSVRDGHFVLGLAGPKGFHFEIDSASWDYQRKYVKLVQAYDAVDSLIHEDQIWNGDGKTKNNGGWQGVLTNKPLTDVNMRYYFADKWAHVVVTYNSKTRVNTMFVNGEKVKQTDFDLWPSWDSRRKVTGVDYDGQPAPADKLALGFIQSRQSNVLKNKPWASYTDQYSNHFWGLMDDVWIFSRALTDIESMQLYNSEKP